MDNETNKTSKDLRGLYFSVLDKGFVSLVDVMGDDSSIVQAARTSYGKGTKSVSDDRTLIRYLLRNRHTSVFEMVVFKFHIAMPYHVHRQFVRHRMSSMNEYSARYSEVPEVIYDDYELNTQSKNNKQGRTDEVLDSEVDYKYLIKSNEKEAFDIYHQLVENGVAREIARMHLPLNTYTYFYWKIDLHNLLHFLKLRCDSHAQKEIRDYANCLAGIVKECCPVAFEAWYDYSFAASNWTRLDKLLLKKLEIDHYYDALTFEEIKNIKSEYSEKYFEECRNEVGMSKRELEEFWKKLEIPDYTDFSLDLSSAKAYNNIEDT